MDLLVQVALTLSLECRPTQPVTSRVDMDGAGDLQVDVLLIASGEDFAKVGEVVKSSRGRQLIAAGLALQVEDGQLKQERPLPVGEAGRVAGGLVDVLGGTRKSRDRRRPMLTTHSGQSMAESGRRRRLHTTTSSFCLLSCLLGVVFILAPAGETMFVVRYLRTYLTYVAHLPDLPRLTCGFR